MAEKSTFKSFSPVRVDDSHLVCQQHHDIRFIFSTITQVSPKTPENFPFLHFSTGSRIYLPLSPSCACPTCKLPDRDFQQTTGSLRCRTSCPRSLLLSIPDYEVTAKVMWPKSRSTHVSVVTWLISDRSSNWFWYHIDPQQPLCQYATSAPTVLTFDLSGRSVIETGRRKDTTVPLMYIINE